MEGNRLLLDCGQEKVRLTAMLAGAVEVRLLRGGLWEPPAAAPAEPSPAVAPAIRTGALGPPMSVEDQGDTLLVTAGRVRVRVARDPVRLTFLDHQGAPLLAEAAGMGYDGWQVGVEFAAAPDDRFYGLGQADQHFGPVAAEASGNRYAVWNKHLPGPARFVLPFVVSRRGYGVFVDNPWPATMDFTGTRPGAGGVWSYQAGGGALAYYFLAGPDMYAVLDHYTRLTGRPTLPPLWSLGYLQSKFGYRNRPEVEELARTFRKKRLPCDAIILDLYWFRYMGDLRFDTAAFPRPRAMIARLRRQGFQTVLIEEPYIGTAARLYREAARRGYLAQRPAAMGGGPWVLPWWHSNQVALVDFSHPGAREWWTREHEALLDLGIAGWWTDLNEPELHHPEMLHHGGPAHAVHNLLGLWMVEAVDAAVRRYAPDQRTFIMSRSGWAGMQRHGAGVWSGDVHNTWQALAQQPVLAMNAGLAGIPGWNSDVGGFLRIGPDTSPELYVRWFQFAVFNPLLRPHADHQDREPWAFGPEPEKIIAAYMRLRYRMLPYNYTYAWVAAHTGAPALRPLVLEFPDDPQVFALADQFMWGRELLVAPVLAPGVRRRRVYLPAGPWYDFWTGKAYAGGRRISVPAPLSRIPLLARAGALIPLGPGDVAHTGELAPAAALTVAFYPAPGQYFFDLYEDDGLTRAHERGQFAVTPLRGRLADGVITLEVAPAHGGLAATRPPRPWEFRVALAAAPASVALDGAPVRRLPDRRAYRQAEQGWWYAAGARAVHVKLAPRKTLTLEVQL